MKSYLNLFELHLNYLELFEFLRFYLKEKKFKSFSGHNLAFGLLGLLSRPVFPFLSALWGLDVGAPRPRPPLALSSLAAL